MNKKTTREKKKLFLEKPLFSCFSLLFLFALLSPIFFLASKEGFGATNIVDESPLCSYVILEKKFNKALFEKKHRQSARSITLLQPLAEVGFMPAQYTLYQIQSPQKGKRTSIAEIQSSYFWLILSAAGYDKEALGEWKKVYAHKNSLKTYQIAHKKTLSWLPRLPACKPATKPKTPPFPLLGEVETLYPTPLPKKAEDLSKEGKTKAEIARLFLVHQQQKEKNKQRKKLLFQSRTMVFNHFIITVDPGIEDALVTRAFSQIKRVLFYIKTKIPRGWVFLSPIQHIHILASKNGTRVAFFRQNPKKEEILFITQGFIYDTSLRALAQTISFYALSYAYDRLKLTKKTDYVGPLFKRVKNVRLFGSSTEENKRFFRETSLALLDFYHLPKEIRKQLQEPSEIYYTPIVTPTNKQTSKARESSFASFYFPPQAFGGYHFDSPLFIQKKIRPFEKEKILFALIENLLAQKNIQKKETMEDKRLSNKNSIKALSQYDILTRGFMDLLQKETEAFDKKKTSEKDLKKSLYCKTLSLDVSAAKALRYSPASLDSRLINTPCQAAAKEYHTWLSPGDKKPLKFFNPALDKPTKPSKPNTHVKKPKFIPKGKKAPPRGSQIKKNIASPSPIHSLDVPTPLDKKEKPKFSPL